MQRERTRLPEALAIQRVHRLVKTDRLRALREDLGLSQSDVARHLGVAASNVSRWESGSRVREAPTPSRCSSSWMGRTDVIRDDAVLTVTEAAKVLRISPRTYYMAAARGEVPATRIGRRLVVSGAALRRFLEGEAKVAPQ